MYHPKGFPSKLARLRANADMTQKDLSRASGISVPQIGRYEAGTSAPRMNALIKLSKALGVELTELQEAENEPEMVSFTVNERGADDYPLTIPRETLEQLQRSADELGVSINAMFVATIEFAKAAALGKPIEFDEALNKALTFLEEDPVLPR